MNTLWIMGLKKLKNIIGHCLYSNKSSHFELIPIDSKISHKLVIKPEVSIVG